MIIPYAFGAGIVEFVDEGWRAKEVKVVAQSDIFRVRQESLLLSAHARAAAFCVFLFLHRLSVVALLLLFHFRRDMSEPIAREGQVAATAAADRQVTTKQGRSTLGTVRRLRVGAPAGSNWSPEASPAALEGFASAKEAAEAANSALVAR